MNQWVNDLNTTNARIVISIGLAVFVVIVVTVGVTFMAWEPTAMQLKVLTGVGAGILTMQGFDVLQFWTKRSTDATLAAAKNPSQPVQATVVSETPKESGDPEIRAALQYGADRDAYLAAGGHKGERGDI